jgi:hypothetical protein
MNALDDYVPDQLGEWRRVVMGLVMRSLLTVIGYAFGGFFLFAFVALLTELVFVDGGWIRALYPLYLLLGALVGANFGLTKAIRREARIATEHSTGVLGLLVDRAVGEMAIPEDGIETERLRALAELEEVAPPSAGTLTRMFAGFALARVLQTAGVAALREQMLRVAREAESRGDRVVSQEAMREAARNGIAVAFADQLDVGWQANEGVTRLTSALALVSLPVLAILFG